MNEAVPRLCRQCGLSLTGGAVGDVCGGCFARGFLADSPAVETVRYMGDYELVERLGEGGMGVVWRARQRSLNRFVAVKLIKSGVLDSAAAIDWFRREAEAVARLQHPNIVTIHEAGEDDGQHYFSMDLVSGRSLAAILETGRADSRDLAAWLRTVAQAVHHAHQNGVLHCDLKPGNILIDDSGMPRVLDFGLAHPRRSSGAGTSTIGIPRRPLPGVAQPGTIGGTPGYMAPEQLTGGLLECRTDVFALGAILGQALTGREPELTWSGWKRRLESGVPRDLAAICLRCLAVDPAGRYRTAAQLASDLGRWLEHRPVVARPAGVWNRLWLWRRRHPAIAALLGVLVLVAAWVSNVLRREAVSRRLIQQAAERNETQLAARVDGFIDGRFAALWSVGRLDLLLSTIHELQVEMTNRPPGRVGSDDDRNRSFQLALREAEAWRESRQPARAAAAARRAVELAERVAVADAGSLRWQTNSAIAHGVLGDVIVQGVTPRRAESIQLWDRARAQWEQLAARGFTGAASGLAEAWLALAHQQVLHGQAPAASGSVGRAEDLWRTGQVETNGWGLLKLGECQYVRGLVALTNRNRGDAGRAFSNYLELSRQAVATEPREIRSQAWLASAHLRLAETREREGDNAAARRFLESAWTMARMLVARDPANLRWQSLHTRVSAWRLLLAQGLPFHREQREWHRDTTNGCHVFLASWPEDWAWLNDLASAHAALAELELRAGHLKEAEVLWRQHQAVRARQAAAGVAATDAQIRAVVAEQARGYRKLAVVFTERRAGAPELVDHARAALEWGADVKPSANGARDLAWTCLLAAEAPGLDAVQAAEAARLARWCRESYFLSPTVEVDRDYADRLQKAAGQHP